MRTGERRMKILILYCGIGGTNKLWSDEHEITAVENNLQIAAIYKDLHPEHNLIIGDAHEYLLKHFKEFNFIWTSPPCQSHSSFRQNICVRFRGTEPKFPDMKLYEEILFLKYNSICPYVVENVKPYYVPLIEGRLIQRHMFWSNLEIPDITIDKDNIRAAQIPDLEKKYGFDLSKYKLNNKRQVLRNCVEPKLGLHILQQVENKQCEQVKEK